MHATNLQAFPHLLVGLMVIFITQACWGYTYEQDVYALNNLYTSLGSPILPGWIPNGGDPCLEGWQGIQCVGPNITSISNGNPFNTTISPSSSSPLPSYQPPVSPNTPSNPVREPSVDSVQGDNPPIRQKKLSTQRIIGCVFAAMIAVIILVLALMLIANYCMPRYQGGKSFDEELPKRHELGPMDRHKVNTSRDHPSTQKNESSKMKKVTAKRETAVKQEKHCEVDTINMSLPPPPDELVANPATTTAKARAPSPEKHDFLSSVIKLNPPMPVVPRVVKPNIPTAILSFSVGSLQQYTNSFSEENIIRDGRFGRVYQAELPNGNLSAIMKLDNANNALPEDVFYELVFRLSGLQHPNIVELVGFCVEYGQRLLVYNYFSRRTLHDVLHSGDDLKRKLSWNARIQVALRAARALEYLHEACQPPVVHQNFESTNILLNTELDVCICDCGLGSLLSLNSISQLSGRIQCFSYEAPEIDDSGSYTEHSDVYSFGVVMLELLTGRKPYDSSQPRSEQYLVRWASSQYHDIDMLTKMVDPSVDGKYPIKSLSRFADIISRCVQHTPEFRPVMSEVVQDLERMVDETKRSPT